MFAPSKLDELLTLAGKALRTLYVDDHFPSPAQGQTEPTTLTTQEKKEAVCFMRVNHTGEICAQALYEAQAWMTHDPILKQEFLNAGQEEAQHLSWCKQRIQDLGGKPSILGPFWYFGAFAIGSIAGRFGDGVSLGFLAETEKQVVDHLESHLQKLPSADLKSKAVLQQMQQDEAKHATQARHLGGVELPTFVKQAMHGASYVMKTVSFRI